MPVTDENLFRSYARKTHSAKNTENERERKRETIMLRDVMWLLIGLHPVSIID
jgi:hypothetical protein